MSNLMPQLARPMACQPSTANAYILDKGLAVLSLVTFKTQVWVAQGGTCKSFIFGGGEGTEPDVGRDQ